MKLTSTLLQLLTLGAAKAFDDDTPVSYENCDANALTMEQQDTISSLGDGKFYKICPGQYKYSNGTVAPLGQPRCGDGSNYSFYYSSPEEQQSEDKLLIELSGGGACWSAETCKYQQAMLKMPPFDFIMGLSCSNLGMIAQSMQGWDVLCARTVGSVDFTTYNTVIIPYCTQDVHLGDGEATYDGVGTVYHYGAHNTYRTLQWVFKNFEDPKHIVLTGCSAGGTPLPVVYRLINEYYKTKGVDVKIDVLSDSPVYLTTNDFLENYFPLWNHQTVMNEIGFDYDSFKNDVQYPSAVIDYVMDGSDSNDGFGIVTHDDDPISIMFYTAMDGNGTLEVEGDMEGEATDNLSLGLNQSEVILKEWWNKMNESFTQATDEHENFDIFIMDGSGHCSSGLYFPMENHQPAFEEWVANMIDGTPISNPPLQLDANTTSTPDIETSVESAAEPAESVSDVETAQPIDALPSGSVNSPYETSEGTMKFGSTYSLIAAVLSLHLLFLLFD